MVYVDNDPVAVQHALLQLEGNPRVGIVQEDLTAVDAVLDSSVVGTLLDLSEPIAVLMFAVLHFLPGERAYSAVAAYRERISTGSYLALSHATDECPTVDDAVHLYQAHQHLTCVRPRTAIHQFFHGFNLAPPGLVLTPQWQPDWPVPDSADATRSLAYGGVGKKPSPTAQSSEDGPN